MAEDPRIRRSPASVGRCPICGEPRRPEFRPFCSRRCRNVDLGRWFNEVYTVPAVDSVDDDDEEPDAEETQR